MAEILFRSDQLEIRRIAAGDGRHQAVTFDSYHEQPDLSRPGFGEDYFTARGITAIHILCAGNDWFQYDDFPDLLSRLRDAVAGAERVLAYGSSMGGYAAVRFAAAIGAHAALALSPQYSLDRAKVPFETRWAQDQRRIRFLPALEGAIRAAPLMVVAYDPRILPDRLHAQRIEAEAPVVLLPLPFAGHPVGSFLNDTGLLDPLVQAVLHGEFDPVFFAIAARAARRISPQWLSQLASAQPAWRAATSVALAERAAQLAPDRAPILNTLALRLAAAGCFEEAVAMHHRTLAIEPVVDYAWGLCKTLHASGDLPGALHVARTLQADAPHVAGYHAWAAKLQGLMGDTEGELRDLQRALTLDPTNPAYRLVVRKVVWQFRMRRWLGIRRRG